MGKSKDNSGHLCEILDAGFQKHNGYKSQSSGPYAKVSLTLRLKQSVVLEAKIIMLCFREIRPHLPPGKHKQVLADLQYLLRVCTHRPLVP